MLESTKLALTTSALIAKENANGLELKCEAEWCLLYLGST